MKEAKGYRLILGYLGVFIAVTGIICLLPLFALFAYPNESQYALGFVIPGCSAIIVGLALMLLIFKRDKKNLGKHQDSVLLVAIWLFAVLICAVPFLFIDMSFTDSVFESTSCFATVGLTVFNKFDLHIYTLYRALIAFFGGVGLVLVVTSAISDRYGLKLYNAEGHNDKLLPNIAKSARLILLIYAGFIIIGSLAFSLAGMDVFDAVCHSISALATGGMSSRSGGFAEAAAGGNIIAIEIIACVLMVLGGTNFLIHFFLITGKFSKVFRDCEIRLFLCVLVVFIPLMILSVWLNNQNLSGGTATRYGLFTLFSAITTTGFTNVTGQSFVSLGASTLFLIFLLTLIGGGMGSTAGGIKQFRVAVICKSFYWNVREKLSSKRVIYPHYIYRCGEHKEVSEEKSIDVYGYAGLYMAVLFACTVLITLFETSNGWSFGDCLFEFSNAISSTGLSVGLTGAATTTIGTKWVLSIGMFAGRLEIIPIYFAIFRIVRDILRKETV